MGSQVAHRLTEKQTTFIEGVAAGEGILTAATKAGYAWPGEAKRYLLSQPHMLTAVEQAVRGRLRGELGPEAFGVLVEIMRDKKVSPRVRADCAKTITSLAGYIPPKAEAPESQEARDPHEMSDDELLAAIDKAEAELGSRARRVEPIGEPVDSQLFDMLD